MWCYVSIISLQWPKGDKLSINLVHGNHQLKLEKNQFEWQWLTDVIALWLLCIHTSVENSSTVKWHSGRRRHHKQSGNQLVYTHKFRKVYAYERKDCFAYRIYAVSAGWLPFGYGWLACFPELCTSFSANGFEWLTSLSNNIIRFRSRKKTDQFNWNSMNYPFFIRKLSQP